MVQKRGLQYPTDAPSKFIYSFRYNFCRFLLSDEQKKKSSFNSILYFFLRAVLSVDNVLFVHQSFEKMGGWRVIKKKGTKTFFVRDLVPFSMNYIAVFWYTTLIYEVNNIRSLNEGPCRSSVGLDDFFFILLTYIIFCISWTLTSTALTNSRSVKIAISWINYHCRPERS